MQLAMEVAVIAELVSFDDSAVNDVGPAFGMPPENEESRLHTELPKCVENARSGVRIRAIVEREGNLALSRGQVAQNGTEDLAVSVKRSVDNAARERQTDRRGKYHIFAFAGPSTPM